MTKLSPAQIKLTRKWFNAKLPDCVVSVADGVLCITSERSTKYSEYAMHIFPSAYIEGTSWSVSVKPTLFDIVLPRESCACFDESHGGLTVTFDDGGVYTLPPTEVAVAIKCPFIADEQRFNTVFQSLNSILIPLREAARWAAQVISNRSFGGLAFYHIRVTNGQAKLYASDGYDLLVYHMGELQCADRIIYLAPDVAKLILAPEIDYLDYHETKDRAVWTAYSSISDMGIQINHDVVASWQSVNLAAVIPPTETVISEARFSRQEMIAALKGYKGKVIAIKNGGDGVIRIGSQSDFITIKGVVSNQFSVNPKRLSELLKQNSSDSVVLSLYKKFLVMTDGLVTVYMSDRS